MKRSGPFQGNDLTIPRVNGDPITLFALGGLETVCTATAIIGFHIVIAMAAEQSAGAVASDPCWVIIIRIEVVRIVEIGIVIVPIPSVINRASM
jgi:hypothetical protein